ncbi:DUF697 domain-containing protein [Oleidesulfovibrio alaskensis]|jgi:hypothetical protein|uniref:DUF697 domain-containing protein n=1 Tax=Oleidesulfovibrio alaskensis TaxID=58180 RepID=UPI001A6443EB|nr:DUF697 domain-containing protein [Oleidesulfovibrio alaskensis]MBL3582306.1 DUF697 domain-containing protein [Oleidesulfovibrio alaskensis]
MLSVLKRFFMVAGILLLVLFAIYLWGAVSAVWDMAERMHEGLGPWAGGAAMSAVAWALWYAVAPFFRPRALVLPAEPDELQLEEYRAELVRRLGDNAFLRGRGVSVHSREDADAALALLGHEADEMIRSAARQVFTGTAVSQNGRLDSLIVFVVLCRLVWRVSALYNQRPSPAEMLSLYSNVAVTSFLAAGMEDLGGEEAMGGIIGPAVASSALGALPGAEAVAATVTASLVDGSANALLTLRTGILARNYVSGTLPPAGSYRRTATAEALSMLAGITGETVRLVLARTGRAAVQVCGDTAAGAVNAGVRTARKAAAGVADGMGGAARAVGWGVRRSVYATGAGVSGGARVLRTGAGQAVSAVGGTAALFSRAVGRGALRSAEVIGAGVKGGSKMASGVWTRTGGRAALFLRGAVRLRK